MKKAIVDAENNLTKAAALLGCSRTALYTWIYQLGLERFAGVCIDRRPVLDRRDRKDNGASFPEEQSKRVLTQDPSSGPTLRIVQAAQAIDLPLNATVKLPESLWKSVKIEAIRRGCTVSEYVQKSLEATVAAGQQRKPAKPETKK